MKKIILSRDGYDGSDNVDIIADAVRIILIEQCTATLWEGSDCPHPLLSPFVENTSGRLLLIAITADLLKPAIEAALRNDRVKNYLAPPIVRVTLTRFDLFLEFS